MKRAFATVLPLIVLLAPAPSRADDDDPWFVETDVSLLGGLVHREPTGGGDLLFAFGRGTFRVALAAPMRFDAGGLRAADWDELADYGRILADAGYGRPDDTFFVRAGTLAGVTLGTGCLFSRFHGTVDPDHWRTGIHLGLHYPVAGADAFIDSFLAPGALGGRAYVRPFQPVDEHGPFGRIEIGFTLGGDVSAPAAWARAPGTATTPGPIVMGDASLPSVSTTRVLGVGVDLRWPILKRPDVELGPYAAWGHADGGNGVHAGIDVSFSAGSDVRIGMAAEFRRLWAGYVAPFFDTSYMVDRWDFAGAPKAASSASFDDDRYGAGASFRLRWSTKLAFWTLFDFDPNGRATSLRAGFDLAIDPVRASLLFAEKGMTSGSAIVDPDRLLFAVVVDVTLHPVIALFASYARDAAVETGGADRGRYRPSDTVLAGLRVQMRPL